MVRVTQPIQNPEMHGAFDDGSFIIADFGLNVPASGFEISPGVLTRYSSNGTFIDSLGSYPWREIGMLDVGRGMVGSRPFFARTTTAIRGDRFWIGTGNEPTIDV